MQLVKNKSRAGELRKNGRKYLLSGFIRCGVCGYACNGSTSTSRVSGGTKKYSYYGCASNRADPGVGAPPHRAPSIAADWIEDLVWTEVRAFLENPGVVLERLRFEGIDTDASLDELETRRDDLTRRLAAKNAEKDRYVRTYAQGHISEEELADYMADIKNQVSNLKLLISSVEDDLVSLGASRLEVQSAAEWLSALREGVSEVEAHTPEAFQKRRELVRLLVEGITTDRDENGHPRVEITYRFGPPTEETFVSSVRNTEDSPVESSSLTQQTASGRLTPPSEGRHYVLGAAVLAFRKPLAQLADDRAWHTVALKHSEQLLLAGGELHALQVLTHPDRQSLPQEIHGPSPPLGPRWRHCTAAR
jgi:Recombinase zinc beta ribbon domain